MSLIRNGGFERGNTDFWEVETGGTLQVSTVSPKYGTYCGVYTSSGNVYEDIINKDYIEVSPYDIINLVGWIKSGSSREVVFFIYMYDSDYGYIGALYSRSKFMDGYWDKFHLQFTLPDQCAYIRVGIGVYSSVSGEVFYIDGIGLDIITSQESISGVVDLLSKILISSSGDTSDDKKDMKQFSSYYAQLRCSAAYGTTPTLDVTVCELDEFDYEIELASFSQVTGAGYQTIQLPLSQGSGMYIKYTLGGTNPQFNFGVAVIGKR